MGSRLELLFGSSPLSLDMDKSRHLRRRQDPRTEMIFAWTVYMGGSDLVIWMAVGGLTLEDVKIQKGNRTLHPDWKYDKLTWVVMGLTAIMTVFKFLLAADGPRNRVAKIAMAGSRIAMCLAYLIYATHDPSSSSIKNTAPVALLVGAILSLLSMVGIIYGLQILVWFEKRFSFLGTSTRSTSTEYSWNTHVVEAMVYLTQPQRKKLQELAAEQMKGTTTPITRQRRWYSPMHRLKDQDQPTGEANEQRNGESAHVNSTEQRNMGISQHFSRCYCCLESDYLLEDPRLISFGKGSKSQRKRPVKTSRAKESSWSEKRREYLNQPSMSHFGNLAKSETSAFAPHTLCEKCSNMCEDSRLMNGGGDKSMKWEMFDHWETPQKLKDAAEIFGCHLCTMMWNTMNSEQQESLLLMDNELATELQSDQSSVNNDELQKFYTSKRILRIRIEKYGQYSRTSMTGSGRVSQGEVQRLCPYKLVPHFGGTRIVQRWMNQRVASRAISMGEDPGEEWHREQAEAIIISRQNTEDVMYDYQPGPVRLPLSTSTGSDESMTVIKKWLEAHKHCHEVPATTNRPSTYTSTDADTEGLLLTQITQNLENCVLPTRLIDVGSADDELVYIRTSNPEELQFGAIGPGPGIDGNLKYLALSQQVTSCAFAKSHCSWGKSEFLTLKIENQKHFMTKGLNISHPNLARTFQDAISVTRRLGYRYLWIDSLCIIQDLKADWVKEGITMQSVYSNASFVIAALAPWDSSETFFVEQNPLDASPCLVTVSGRSPKTYRGLYALPASKYTVNSWLGDVQYSRLSSRAWCFQEERLAKRIVYFGEHQIYFNCKAATPEMKECRTSQVGIYPWKLDEALVHKPSIPKESKRSLTQLLAGAQAGDYFEIYKRWRLRPRVEDYNHNQTGEDNTSPTSENILSSFWWYMVSQYSMRYLTYLEDKLIALAGVAAYCQQSKPESIYLAGLWGGEYLHMGLLWYVEDGRKNKQLSDSDITKESRRPSWSWGTVAGTIANNSSAGCASTSRIRCEIKGLFPSEKQFGPDVSNAYLQVYGALKAAKWSPCDTNEQLYYRGHKRSAGEIISENDLADSVPCIPNQNIGPAVLELRDEAGKKVGWIIPDREDSLPDRIYCLRIVVEPESKGLKEDFGIPWATRGLVLVHAWVEAPMNLGWEKTYLRVGYFELCRSTGGLTWPDIFSGPLSVRGPLLPIRRPGPDIDVHDFFDQFPEEEIYIM